MLRARFRIRVPEEDWVGQLSRSFPGATFRLLSGIRIDDRAIELGEVRTDDPDAVAAAIVEHPDVVDLEPLGAADDRLLGKYETTSTGIYEFVEEMAAPPEYPLVVRDGWVEFDLTGTRDDFDRFRSGLESAGDPYELRYVVDPGAPETLLTDRQREALEAAVREGYFAIPRECTLSELAETLGVDKSTASDVIRRGEIRIVRWFLTGVDDRGSARR